MIIGPKDKIKALGRSLPQLTANLEACSLCPRKCGINRLKGERGYCGAGKELMVYTVFLHQGEEPGISEKPGSGTIFFSGCSLKCVYCQNFKFSHDLTGRRISIAELAKIMIKLQDKGAVNINLVTPTHFLPQISQALLSAYSQGLNIPVVYNTSGYENPEIIAALNGIVDVYLTDSKYATSLIAEQYSQAADYPQLNRASLREMYGQKNCPVWKGDILNSGIVVRHLVLPGHLDDTKIVLLWLRENLPKALASVMFQYQPYHAAAKSSQINRALREDECREVKQLVEDLGLDGWVQEYDPDNSLAGVNFTPGLDEFLAPG